MAASFPASKSCSAGRIELAELHLPSCPEEGPLYLSPILPTTPTPRPPGLPLLRLTVLHLDNIAGGHPVRSDQDIVWALNANEVLHGAGKREAAGSTQTEILSGYTA